MTNSRSRIRFLSSLAAVVLASSGFIAAGALPAAAASSSQISKYVSLGDSYAAGTGAGPYLNACQQSLSGYPALLDAVKGVNLVRNASCQSATTTDVVATQLSTLNRGTTLVTLTVGGNDLGVVGVAAACVPDSASIACQTALATALFQLNSGALAINLATSYAAVVAAAPNARVLVTGYPYLFDAALNANPAIAVVNGATATLNATILGVVGAGNFVDVSAAFAAHGIGSAVPWIVLPAEPDAFHPNALGYAAYAAAIQAKL